MYRRDLRRVPAARGTSTARWSVGVSSIYPSRILAWRHYIKNVKTHIEDEHMNDRLLVNKMRPAGCACPVGGKSETHLTYARLLLNQIGDVPVIITKRRHAFLRARLPFIYKARHAYNCSSPFTEPGIKISSNSILSLYYRKRHSFIGVFKFIGTDEYIQITFRWFRNRRI
jgi:hypothetical protein